MRATTVENYLDIKRFVVNELIGDPTLTYFVFLIILLYFAIKFKAGTESIVGLTIVYTLLMALVLQSVLLVIAGLILVALLAGMQLSKKISR